MNFHTNIIQTLELKNNSIFAHYTELVSKRTETILNNVHSTKEGRIKLLQKIEDKLSKCPKEETHFENYYSLLNRYMRQWEALAILIYGFNNDLNKPNTPYNFDDVIGS